MLKKIRVIRTKQLEKDIKHRPSIRLRNYCFFCWVQQLHGRYIGKHVYVYVEATQWLGAVVCAGSSTYSGG